MAVMDFWVCFISDTLLNLHWTVAALGPSYQHHTFAALSLSECLTKHLKQLRWATFVTIPSHRHDNPSPPNASGRLSLPWLAHVSSVDCFQKHQDEISGDTLSVKELFGAFSLAPCAVRAWKSSPCLVVTCRSLSHGDGERTRLAPWWEGGSTVGAHCNPPPLPAGPAGINRNPFKCYMCSRDVCHSASSWESLRFPLLHVSVKSAVASPVQIWCGDRLLELSMDTVTWACGACRCSPWYSYLDYLQAPVH